MNGNENDDQVSRPQPSAPSGHSDPTSRPHEPTTMRLPGINDLEQVDTSAEIEVALSKADQATVDALRPGTALLVVLRGPNTGARFLLDDDEVNSGRHPDSDIFLDDVTVSRKHANFRREGDTFVVRDVGSLNGTYVNRERIDEATLQTGDEVQIGKFRLVFYAGKA
ncbi:FHA domain-containing protein [Pedococcus bigeumensis]|uniref:FHA domain-containing protein n=1 Tax=Pedococcus bigeumensis TaxID=433644 RepID=A0A502CXQ4_9MICO|nr:FHA domain-containing protein [Pedococcus bigeumensis]